MIRINLLGLKKDTTRSRMPSVSFEGAKSTVIFAVVLVLAVGVLAGRYLLLTSEGERLRTEIKAADAEKTRLARVKTELDQFEQRRELLTHRISMIEALKKDQTGPVNALNALADTVEASGTLWLTAFDTTGRRLRIDGVAASVKTVADFITNLNRSGQFANVEIRDTYEDDRNKDLTVFMFSITAEMAQAGPSS
jgi:Tfp pilus assembly protein PilN